MTKEELSLAISYIDDALISEAYEKKTKGRSFYVKFAALAASLFLVVGLSIPLIPMLMRGGVGGDAGENDALEGENDGSGGNDYEQGPDKIYLPGSTAEGAIGKIEFISVTGNEMTVRYEKRSAGYTHFYLDCTVEIGGEEKRYVATSDAFYNYGADGYDGILLDKIKIYIDGELSADGYLPLEVGEYDITLDLTELYNIQGLSLEDKLLISGFGYFRIK